MARSVIIGKRDDISEILPLEKFFPPPDYDDPVSFRKRFYIKTGYRDELYCKYKDDENFRISINKVLKARPPVLVNDRIIDLIKCAIHGGIPIERNQDGTAKNEGELRECFILEANGHTGCGKTALIRNCIIPLYAVLVRRNYIIHCDKNKLEDCYPVTVSKDFKTKPFHVYVTYSNSETNEIIKGNFEQGDIIMQDEMPEQHGKGSSISVGNMENILRIASRKKGLNVIFITPELIEVKSVDYYITVIAVNKLLRATLVMISTSEKNHVGCSLFRINQDDAQDEYYERVSSRRKQEILDSGGFSSVELSEEKEEQLVEELKQKVLNKAKKERVRTIYKKYIEGIARTTKLANEIFFEEIVGIVFGQLKDVNPMAEEIKLSDEKNRSGPIGFDSDDETAEETTEENQIEESEPSGTSEKEDFEIDVEMILNRLVTNGKISKQHATMFWDAIKPGVDIKNVLLKYRCMESNLTVIKRRVGEHVAKVAGREYETFMEEKFKKDPEVDHVVHETSAGKPDLVVYYKNGEIVVYSLKCYSVDPRTRPSVSISRDKILPEIVAASELKKDNPGKDVRCYLKFYNPITKKTHDRLVDYRDDKETTYLVKIAEKKGVESSNVQSS